MSFGEQLQRLRRVHDLTQEEFAEQLQVSRQSVSKWESSQGYPGIEKILYICNTYSITMDELFSQELLIHHEQAEEETADPQQTTTPKQKMKNPGLVAAFKDFFANLSPRNQAILGGVSAALLLAVLILVSTSLMKGETNQMMMEIIWMGLLLFFGIGEALTVGLTSIWFAAGALSALVCSMLGGNTALQIVLFFVVSTLCIAAFRPIAQKFINNKTEPTNVDGVVGREVLVTEMISNLRSEGTVSVSGLTWSARSADNSEIPAGTLVRILRVEGVKVFVEKV